MGNQQWLFATLDADDNVIWHADDGQTGAPSLLNTELVWAIGVQHSHPSVFYLEGAMGINLYGSILRERVRSQLGIITKHHHALVYISALLPEENTASNQEQNHQQKNIPSSEHPSIMPEIYFHTPYTG